jgi:hypothetical protein
MKTLKDAIDRLNGITDRIGKANEQLAALKANLRDNEVAREKHVNELLLTVAATSGLSRLPPQIIVAGIIHVVRESQNEEVITQWIAAAGDALEASEGKKRRGRRRANVALKLSASLGQELRDRVKELGLRWNGRRNAWTGHVSEEQRAGLQAEFGERVVDLSESAEIRAVPVPSIENREEADGPVRTVAPRPFIPVRPK